MTQQWRFVQESKPIFADFDVAQVSNLLYRRFPIGKASPAPVRLRIHGVRRLEALRYSATTLSAAVVTMELFNAVTMQLVC